MILTVIESGMTPYKQNHKELNQDNVEVKQCHLDDPETCHTGF